MFNNFPRSTKRVIFFALLAVLTFLGYITLFGNSKSESIPQNSQNHKEIPEPFKPFLSNGKLDPAVLDALLDGQSVEAFITINEAIIERRLG